MSILSKLASSLHRRDEVPNQELAQHIVDKGDTIAVKELIESLHHKRKDIQNDCIKVLYEIGSRKPALISAYVKDFISLLDHKNNRLQWGAMTAIHTITLENPKLIFASLNKIITAMDRGSVITKDYGVNILISLCSLKVYADRAFPLLIEQLLKCPTNQLPMYAERATPVIHENNKKLFVATLTTRLNDIDKESKRKRVEKVIRKFE